MTIRRLDAITIGERTRRRRPSLNARRNMSRDTNELLEEAARLTLRLSLRCNDWLVEGANLDSLNSLWMRIQDLMHAYVISEEGKMLSENMSLSNFAMAVANAIANVPSIQEAVVANLDDPYLDDTIDPVRVRAILRDT